MGYGGLSCCVPIAETAADAESSRSDDEVARMAPRNGSEKRSGRDNKLPSIWCTLGVRFFFIWHLLGFERALVKNTAEDRVPLHPVPGSGHMGPTHLRD